MKARAIAKRVGLLACRCAALASSQRPAVLLYHSVGGEGGVPASAFARQLDYVAEHFRTVVLSDLPGLLGGAGESRTPACITLDDGYRDNVEVALPLLEARGVRATFFLISGLLGSSFPSRAGHPLMDAGDAQGLVARGHEVGAHTRTHPRLTRLDAAEARREIEGSKAELEDLLGVAVTSFAYPKGDHNDAVRAAVGNAGFGVAVTVREGLVGPEPDWLALPRASARPGEGALAFHCKLHPGIDLYERLVRRP
jgi:peptidoglycan/xylan/chitin deacetylase (PgdA/CDA1 family)